MNCSLFIFKCGKGFENTSVGGEKKTANARFLKGGEKEGGGSPFEMFCGSEVSHKEKSR